MLDLKKQKRYLKQLVESVEREIVNCSVQLFIYEKELNEPVHIGKEQARQGIDTYKQRLKNLNANLAAYTLYVAEIK